MCDEKGTDPFSWMSLHSKKDTKVDGLFVLFTAACLGKGITIFSHCEPWNSEVDPDGDMALCFAGNNLFCATEVGTYVKLKSSHSKIFPLPLLAHAISFITSHCTNEDV